MFPWSSTQLRLIILLGNKIYFPMKQVFYQTKPRGNIITTIYKLHASTNDKICLFSGQQKNDYNKLGIKLYQDT